MSQLARLKPLNDRKGHKVKLYMIEGLRFYVERGWYEVSDEVAAKLRDLHQDHYDLDSPLLFDVASPSEAEAIERAERASGATARATVQQPASPLAYRPPSEARGTQPVIEEAATVDEPSASGHDPEVGRMTGVGRVSGGSGKGPKTRVKR